MNTSSNVSTLDKSALPAQTEPRVNWRTHFTLLLLALIYVFSFIDRNVIAIVMEPIRQEFGVSDSVMGFLSGLAFASLYALISLPMGQLADKGVNRRNIIAICCSLWSLATVACGAVAQFWQLVIARMTVAVGEAGGMAPSVSMVSDLYPKNRRSLAISVMMLGPHIGLLAAMVAGGYIAQEYGWRYVFYIFGAPGLLLAALLWLFTKDPRQQRQQAAPVKTAEDSLSLVKRLGLIIKIPGMFWLCTASGFAGLAGYGFGIWVPSFMVRHWDISLTIAGLSFGLASGVFAAVGSIFSGWYCDKRSQSDKRWQLWLPIIGIVISFPFGLAFLFSPADAMWQIGSIAVPSAMLFVVFFSFFNSWWPTLSYAAVSHLTTDKQRATGAAVLNLFVTLCGAGIGPFLTGVLSDVFSSHGEAQGLAIGLAITLCFFLVAAACYALGVNGYARRVTQLQQS
ncbi:MFS transporter [Thalassotalea ponticola]|uniref:spinster family MFS transporter n=1 Tax=Thalassotalea ponticola TaxID=1523392 RepID=UPI0025B6106F|nr:MFS transporter [Thalassotalea ponticola]MDN3653799.1 MFS transporter [Thalassotalea ponticola]